MKSIPAAAGAFRCLVDVPYGGKSPRQTMDIFMPEPDGEAAPIVIDVHGGGWESGDKGDLGAGRALVLSGHVYAKINYRRSVEAPWPACVEDVKSSIRFLRANAFRFGGDAGRMALTGHSAGSHLGMIAAFSADTGLWTTADNAEVSERVQALVSQAGVVDLWRRYRRNFYDAGFRAEEERKFGLLLGRPLSEEALRPLSVLEHLATAGAPLACLLVYAEKDRLAPPEDALLLASAVRERGWPLEYHCLPGADHVDPRFWQGENLARIIDFLWRNLGSRSSARLSVPA